MLTFIGDCLQDLGLVTHPRSLRYVVNLTTGDAMSITTFLDERRFFHVRASEYVSLEPIYAAQCRAFSDHPTLVPRPHGHLRRDGWSFVVSDGVAHRLIRRADVLRRAGLPMAPLSGQLLAYFAGQGRNADSGLATPGVHASLLERIDAHFRGTALAPVASHLIGQARAAGVEAMPVRPQHGDFVANNLGRTGRKLVIFDWEDYGKASLPGLDVVTLMLSLVGMDEEGLRSLTGASRSAALDAFVCRACSVQGLDPAVFRKLVPFYVLVFLYLKRAYGMPVQNRLAILIQGLASGPDATQRRHGHDPLMPAP